MLWDVTVSGTVILVATRRGTPTWSKAIPGSGVITDLAEKSTLFPIRFPLSLPSLPFSLSLIAFNALPDFCLWVGWPAI